jgi:flagellin
MTVINTNIKALYTQQALKVSARDSQTAMQQLSTGKRINSSKDDAAGLAIAARMTQNIQGLKQAVRNAGDAISLIQTAEGATNEISAMLQRMSELAVQSANSTYSADQRSYLDQEFQQLKQEIVRISETHEWNGFAILNGKAGLPVGAPITTTISRPVVGANSLGATLGANDLLISTGDPQVPYTIPASSASDDTKSNSIAYSSDPAGSAIAIAAAINSRLSVTGVGAVANGAVIDATQTTVNSTKSTQTDLYVNGTKVSLSLSSTHTKPERRQYVMDSINSSTSTHGVTAADSGSGGLTLTTVDGRNLSVWYDGATYDGSDFGLGMNTSLPTDPPGVTGVANATAAAVSTTGVIENTSITFQDVPATKLVTINDLVYTNPSTTSAIVAADVAKAFQNLSAGTTAAQANAAALAAGLTGTFSGGPFAGFSTGAASGAVVKATASSGGVVTNIVTSSSSGSTALGISTTEGAAGVAASTVYGTVTLNSMKAFTIGPGTSGSTNFELLGFRGIPVTPKNIGRLSFQVGPAPDQLISIDLSDFGKNGDVTNKITGDQYPTNLNTVENANVVMQAVNQSLDKVAQTRATMGAVMNRLQHVIDNVTNVVTTSEASRSQIEDADYATASTELSRTQIMQQAATAVLAQANTDQQTVLKLLQ